MGILEINSGHDEIPIFNPFPALLSNEFATKTRDFFIFSSRSCKCTKCLTRKRRETSRSA